MCLVQTRHQIPCILHRLNLHLKEETAPAGGSKKAPQPYIGLVGWPVAGVGETRAEQKNEDLVPAHSWTFISFFYPGEAGVVAGAWQGRPTNRGRTSANRGVFHATCGQKGRSIILHAPPSVSASGGLAAQSGGLERQVVGAGFCNGFPLGRTDGGRGRRAPA